MYRQSSRPALIGGAVALAFIGFAVGATTASAPSGDVARGAPIINPDAWSEGQPPAIIETSYSDTPRETVQAECSPWGVSEVAIEEVLLELQRRGWRAPNQGDAIALLNTTGEMSADSVDPDVPMPIQTSRQAGTIVDESVPEALPAGSGAMPISPGVSGVDPLN